MPISTYCYCGMQGRIPKEGPQKQQEQIAIEQDILWET
jgi:hypothetical protein